ncbi:hypothetical protein CH369_18220 [Leptospira levettii]|uniref:hypothetical protein n=1 Tax=Leptospira levettii TaxID=2023178 RepID=UPI000C2A4A15|nr:hypothetical protein [Leptospira levettii]MCW7475567.1 hypothetical protein [Leptospira levettii]PJZ86784.1 hypothetical protein CH368_20230 [Leptospira levettii]PJZ98823.1 hypothetical protein CH369_18220 [Leptospira levettii]
METFLTKIGLIWGVLEPFLFFLPIISNYLAKNRTQVSEKQIDTLVLESFNACRQWLSEIKFNDLSDLDYQKISTHIKNKLKRKDQSYIFFEGDLEILFFEALLPYKDSKRLNNFITYIFFLNKGISRITEKKLIIDRWRLKLFRKYTIYHYLSIPNWITLNYSELMIAIDNVKKIDPLWSDQFLTKNKIIEDNKPRLSKALDHVIQTGKITESAILKFSASEKILIIYKYAEGFSEVYKIQKEELENQKSKLKNLQKQPKPSQVEIKDLKEKIDYLRKNWNRSPINHILEIKGFQNLFINMEGVYLIPTTRLPEKFVLNPKNYIDEIIIPEADQYRKQLKSEKKYRKVVPDKLNYIIISQVVSLRDLILKTSERTLTLSSPAFSKMLLSCYLSKNNSETKNILINDVIRNIDFLSLFNEETQTGKLINDRFELLKTILFDEYSIDIYRPISLITLSEEQVKAISEKLTKGKSLKPHIVKKILVEKINFYRELEYDLNTLKLNK